jgi:hypothetical protein
MILWGDVYTGVYNEKTQQPVVLHSPDNCSDHCDMSCGIVKCFSCIVPDDSGGNPDAVR